MSTDRTTRCRANPSVLFRGRYAFRTLNGAVSVLLPFLTSMIFTIIAVYAIKRGGELLSNLVRIGFLFLALLSGGLSLRALWGWARNERIYVEINERGVVRGRRFWPWEQIRSFIGTRYDNGVELGFTIRGRMVVWGDGSLPTTPLLTEQQYVELAQELIQFLSTRFPDVEVATHPLKPID